MDIFRVETPEHIGPFNMRLEPELSPVIGYMNIYDHPLPWKDGIPANKNMFFGVESLDQARVWFPKPVREVLSRHGYVVNHYTAPSWTEDAGVFKGKHQVAFYPQAVELVDTLPLTVLD